MRELLDLEINAKSKNPVEPNYIPSLDYLKPDVLQTQLTRYIRKPQQQEEPRMFTMHNREERPKHDTDGRIVTTYGGLKPFNEPKIELIPKIQLGTHLDNNSLVRVDIKSLSFFVKVAPKHTHNGEDRLKFATDGRIVGTLSMAIEGFKPFHSSKDVLFQPTKGLPSSDDKKVLSEDDNSSYTPD